MARYSFTLTLTHPTLDDLTVTLSPPSIGFQRSLVQESQLQVTGITSNNNSLFNGPARIVSRRFEWAATVDVTEEQALIIETMRNEQSPTNLIQLIDRYEYIGPEETPSKTFETGSEITILGRTTGYLQCEVILTFPNASKQNIGSNVCNPTLSEGYKEISFDLKEVP